MRLIQVFVMISTCLFLLTYVRAGDHFDAETSTVTVDRTAARAPLAGAATRRDKMSIARNRKVKDQVNIAYSIVSDPHTKLVVNISEAEFDREFARLKEIGFTHVTLWAGVELARNSKAEKLMKLAVRKADEHGLRCYIWFWVAGKPLMYEHPLWRDNSPPFVDMNGKRITYMNLWDRRWREDFLRKHLHWLGKTFSKFPNVEGYVVDEPDGCGWKWKQYGYDEQTQGQFIEWLKKHYKTLGALNDAWDSRHRSWKNVAAPRTEPPGVALSDPESPDGQRWRDWTAARRQFFVDWFADMNRYLKEAHPGCTILWSITARYVDNSQARELADCLDWKRIMPHLDAVLMAKFPGKDSQAVRYARNVLDGLSRKPEMKDAGKVFAIVIWKSSWVEKTRPQTLRKMLELATEKGFGLYVWAWQGKSHLEAWEDLQEVFREFLTERDKQTKKL